MPVIRVEKTKDYTVMANYHLKDKRLSLKAIGLLSKILSLPPDWDYTVDGLASICKDKRDCIRKAIIELEANGYITRSRQRLSNGTLGEMEYTVREKPESSDQQVKKPALENPTLVNPMLGKPTLENPPQLNTNTSSTKAESKKESSTDVCGADAPGGSKRFAPPSTEDVRAYCEERNNGIDPDKFVDYYTAQGWKLSNGQPMKDWRAAVRNWEHRNKEHQVNSGSSSFDEDEFIKAALARTYGGE